MNEKEWELYLKKWYPIIFKLRLLGFETIGFDPGVLVRHKQSVVSIDISMIMIEKLIELVDLQFPDYKDNSVAYQAELSYRDLVSVQQ